MREVGAEVDLRSRQQTRGMKGERGTRGSARCPSTWPDREFSAGPPGGGDLGPVLGRLAAESESTRVRAALEGMITFRACPRG